MTNWQNGTLYVGVTSDLIKRVYEHKNETIEGFTKRYACKNLVFFEMHETMENGINREKKMKKMAREDKLRLIDAINPAWKDLYETIV